MAEQIITQGKVLPVEQTKVQFGALSAPTPQWAIWLFRSVFIVTTAVTIWIAGTGLITEVSKIEFMLILKVIDALALGFSKLFGIVPDVKD